MQYALADVPEEIDERDRAAGDDRCAARDQHPGLTSGREMWVGGVRPERPHHRRDDQRQHGKDQPHGHDRPDDLLQRGDAGRPSELGETLMSASARLVRSSTPLTALVTGDRTEIIGRAPLQHGPAHHRPQQAGAHGGVSLRRCAPRPHSGRELQRPGRYSVGPMFNKKFSHAIPPPSKTAAPTATTRPVRALLAT